MTRITSHVLDTAAGRPAAGLTVRLEQPGRGADVPVPLASARTDADGRIRDWLPDGVAAGRYRLVFETGAWFRAAGRDTLYPEVIVDFQVRDGALHYHLPLLLSPFGYSTYRGS
jgi:5-hydroxyisourate hydrolase